MLKLITLNIETNKHYSRWLPFLDKEKAEVICLQEVPESALFHLQKRGFKTTFAPMIIKELNGIQEKIGVALATKLPHSIQKVYYHRSENDLSVSSGKNNSIISAFAYLIANFELNNDIYTIATTHMADTEDGHEDEYQVEIMNKMLASLAKEKAHCLCGDFNMPRGYNILYEEVTKIYSDSIPQEYKSSLDRNLHRDGKMKLDQPIFDSYMVDYIFTQSPYKADEVCLEFGVSDHAGVVAYISREN